MKYELESVANYYVGAVIKCLFVAVGLIMVLALFVS